MRRCNITFKINPPVRVPGQTDVKTNFRGCDKKSMTRSAIGSQRPAVTQDDSGFAEPAPGRREPSAAASLSGKAGQAAQSGAIQVLDRMNCLLDALANHAEPASLKTLSHATGLHPSTAHRILNDLVLARYVDRIEPGTYQLGLRLLELGNLVRARLSVRDAALVPMRELHRRTGQPVNLSLRRGDEIVYVERAVSERSGMQVVRAIGGRAPLHLTSVGKLFLAADDTRQLQGYALRTGLAGQTRNSLTTLSALERELGLVRARGYARDNEELELGVRCIAAGIHDDAGRLVAGLSISAPAEFMQDGWIERLCRTADGISEALGWESHP
jgi:DNA-binding IclR family transcriptional regulator